MAMLNPFLVLTPQSYLRNRCNESCQILYEGRIAPIKCYPSDDRLRPHFLVVQYKRPSIKIFS